MPKPPDHVVVPLSPSRQRQRRTLDEVLAVRFPGLTRRIARRAVELPLRSRLRRTLVTRRTCQGFVAVNRGDLDVLMAVYQPEAEVDFTAGGAFLPDVARVRGGRDSLRDIWEAWNDAIAGLRLEPDELVDFGSVLLVGVRVFGQGRSSGVPVNDRIHEVYELRGGLIARHSSFREREAAFAIAAQHQATR